MCAGMEGSWLQQLNAAGCCCWHVPAQTAAQAKAGLAILTRHGVQLRQAASQAQVHQGEVKAEMQRRRHVASNALGAEECRCGAVCQQLVMVPGGQGEQWQVQLGIEGGRRVATMADTVADACNLVLFQQLGVATWDSMAGLPCQVRPNLAPPLPAPRGRQSRPVRGQACRVPTVPKVST